MEACGQEGRGPTWGVEPTRRRIAMSQGFSTNFISKPLSIYTKRFQGVERDYDFFSEWKLEETESIKNFMNFG